MFKGERLALVKAYHLKGTAEQPSLPFPEPIETSEPLASQNG
jgi:hypothetical protein